MHHSSEITPFIELRLWEDKDVPMLAKLADKMKEQEINKLEEREDNINKLTDQDFLQK